MKQFGLILAAFLFGIGQAYSQNLCIVAWNVESGDSRVEELSDTVRGFDDCDILGLSEVQNQDTLEELERVLDIATGVSWHSFIGSTGGTDRLAIIYNPLSVTPIDYEELMAVEAERGRAPLAVTFVHRETSTPFMVVVNHLYRGNSGDNRFKRLNQSESLNQWARSIQLPVIAVGDFNYDWNIHSGEPNLGFHALTADGVFEWVMPEQLVGTQCSEDVANPRSVLDFVFVSGAALGWEGVSTILETQSSYCPDDSARSDHRPVRADFLLP